MKLTKTKRTVWIFGLASFLHDMGADMIFSIWPLFLSEVLGANKTAIGLIDGLGDTFVSLSQAGSGYLSDRLRKRKVFVWIGYLFGAIARLGYAISTTWPMVIPFRILDRSGKVRSSPRDAIISDISERKNRGENFGILRTMDNAGAVCGILLSLVLVSLIGYRYMFIVAAIPSLLAVALVFFFVKESKPEKHAIFHGLRFNDLSRQAWLYLIVSAIFELASFSYSFLLLAAVALGFEATSVPILYLLFTVFAALVSFPAGYIADHIGRKPVLLLSFLCFAAMLVLFLIQDGLPLIILAFVMYGLHRGSLDTVQKTFAAELSPKEFVASSLGGFQLVLGLMSLPASLIAGLLWDQIGFMAPFLWSLCLTGMAGTLLLLIRE